MSSLEPTDADLVARIRARQADEWRAGRRVAVEHYLHENPRLALDHNATLDLIFSELLLREEANECVTIDEYVERFPELAIALRRQQLVLASLRGLLVDDDSKALRIPGYEIMSEVGRGGMGVVYRAVHTPLKRIVALKVMRDGEFADERQRDRFRIEAEAIARLRHEHIVRIHDYGEFRGKPFLSLEYVDGGSLETWTTEPLRAPRDVVQLMEHVARAVAYAHRLGIVHRDLKPANILLEKTDDSTQEGHRPKVTDFGLAKLCDDPIQLTHSAALVGTIAYMAPEQATGRISEIGPATDIHALGCVLYQLLTGKPPFAGATLAETLDLIRFSDPLPPSRLKPSLPRGLDGICARCLRKAPADRYATADDLADDLRRVLRGERPSTSSRGSSLRIWSVGLLIAASVALILGAGGYFGSWSSRNVKLTPGSGGHAAQRLNSSKRTEGQRFAFLVGVRTYRFGNDIVQLDYTESDVDELSRVLLRGGYPRANIRLLTQWSEADNPELAPTAVNIRRQLSLMLAQCIPDDTVVVAITGMGGESGPAGMYCYLPADGDGERRESLLALSDLYDLLSDCPAGVKLLLVDTCQTATVADFGWTSLPPPPPGVAAFFACSRGEASYEDERLRHGVFSFHVLRGLEGDADTNRDGTIALGELADYTRSGVQTFLATSQPSATQTPQLVSSIPSSATIAVTAR